MARHHPYSTLTAVILFAVSGWHTGYAAPSIDFFLDRGDYDAAVEEAELASSHPLHRIITHVRKQRLAEHPMWRALVHYRKGISGKPTSQVDAGHFFLSRAGKQDPEKELEATVAAMFAKRPRKPLRLTAYCRFIARRYWLTQQLGELGRLLPRRNCEEFERYRKFLNAEILTVIFPAAQPNSPSSAFGHTLLRVDRRDQDPETRMLNMSINFAAEVPENVNSLSYVVGGLAGGFKGKFRVLPYYLKLREYRQIDNRDIWEYQLNLEQEQIDMILRHAYEMLIAYYDYYFFSENCSYHLLSLLDVAFPEQPLTDEFPLWTIPIDTIRALKSRGLIKDVRYMPSMARIIKRRQQLLGRQEIALATRGYQNGVDAILPDLAAQQETTRARVLDLLSDYQRYSRLNSPGNRAASLSDVEKKTLRLRSRIAIATVDPEVPSPDTPPDEGHGTARVSLGVEERDGKSFGLLQFRPAYHDLLDPVAGYGDHSAIDFFNLSLGWEEDERELFLRSFTLLDIQSLEPRDSFFKPISWRTRIAWEKHAPDLPAQFTALGGAGLAWRTTPSGALGYLFLEGSLIDNKAMEKRTTLAAGSRAGMLWDPVRGLRILSELGYEYDTVNGQARWSASLQAGYSLSKQTALVAKVFRIKSPSVSGGPEQRFEATVRFYF